MFKMKIIKGVSGKDCRSWETPHVLRCDLDLSILMTFSLPDVFKLWMNKGSYLTTVTFPKNKSFIKPAKVIPRTWCKRVRRKKRQKDSGVWLT